MDWLPDFRLSGLLDWLRGHRTFVLCAVTIIWVLGAATYKLNGDQFLRFVPRLQSLLIGLAALWGVNEGGAAAREYVRQNGGKSAEETE